MAAAPERTYNSEYERAVMTKGHPAKTIFKPLDPPEYVRQSSLGPWLATRWEEVVVVAFMLSVLLYCSSVYTVIFAGARLVSKYLGFAWDLALLSMLTTTFAPMGRALRKRTKKVSIVVTIVVAAVRWWRPDLYPTWYPWQPVRS